MANGNVIGALRGDVDALVIGAGPAGLMAAEALASAGRRVVVCDAKPSVGRKFLMAGKSGLNLTKDEAAAAFAAAYRCPRLAPMLRVFGPAELMAWARDLGQEVFTGSSGRVFPVAMKASPLLRAWLARLASLGVEVRTRHRWTGFEAGGLMMETPLGTRLMMPRVTVLALGGASWSRLGSDGAWVPWLVAQGVPVVPFRPANMGFRVDWSAHMAPMFGQAVKGAALCVAGRRERGEFVLSARGLEGGGIYAVSRDLREGALLVIDLLPDSTEAQVAARLGAMPRGTTVTRQLQRLGLSPPSVALMQEFGRSLPLTAVKALPVPLAGPRLMDEAISVAGGVDWAGVTDALELRARPGVFVCGEMLDWEAPTGGYLLTGCMATGLWAGRQAALLLEGLSSLRETPGL